jgi:hypothetical protein
VLGVELIRFVDHALVLIMLLCVMLGWLIIVGEGRRA